MKQMCKVNKRSDRKLNEKIMNRSQSPSIVVLQFAIVVEDEHEH